MSSANTFPPLILFWFSTEWIDQVRHTAQQVHEMCPVTPNDPRPRETLHPSLSASGQRFSGTRFTRQSAVV